jgi:hypothetical protein
MNAKEWPEVGVRGHGSRFSLAYTSEHGCRVRLRIDTSSGVAMPTVLYGGVFMTCTDTGRHRTPGAEHYYEIINPPMGTQVITGTFSEDVYYEVRLVDDAWVSRI